jgi:hypothetical protein
VEAKGDVFPEALPQKVGIDSRAMVKIALAFLLESGPK